MEAPLGAGGYKPGYNAGDALSAVEARAGVYMLAAGKSESERCGFAKHWKMFCKKESNAVLTSP